jgi:hypothetical protein
MSLPRVFKYARTISFAMLIGICHPIRGADYVIHISVDGFGSSYLQQLIDLGDVPNFQRMLGEGAGTLNARTDHDNTTTLPNHTAMITGRPVLDKFDNASSGHLWEMNFDPGEPATLDSTRGFHLSSTFEIAHDHGLSTALYASKPKFEVWNRSYDDAHGTVDVTGPDNGRDKIDLTLITNFDSVAMMSDFKMNMSASPTNYTFVHFHDTDSAGHENGWGSGEYMIAVKTVDGYLGDIFNLIATSPQMNGHTTIVLTTDHGGDIDGDHGDPLKPVDYTIPFLVWGDGVSAGLDLYGLNVSTRLDPGAGRPDYSIEELMPIRNGDSGNLTLDLLGLESIPGSSINRMQDLAVAVPEPAGWSYALCAALLLAARMGRRGTTGPPAGSKTSRF